jgi:hypothetical protein
VLPGTFPGGLRVRSLLANACAKNTKRANAGGDGMAQFGLQCKSFLYNKLWKITDKEPK